MITPFLICSTIEIVATNRYILLVYRETLEAHTVGFRGLTKYQEWWKLLHHFYDPFPNVEHYELVFNHKSNP
jgi:hypothetical protein